MDEAAFSSCVAARRAALFRTACLLCGDPHWAEDIVQDGLARLYGAWDRVSGWGCNTPVNPHARRLGDRCDDER